MKTRAIPAAIGIAFAAASKAAADTAKKMEAAK